MNLSDLDADKKQSLGLRTPRQADFTAEDVACHAIECLAAIAGLSRQKRERVLRHAIRLNNRKIRGTTKA